jgi:cytolysin (calcineurin-like family phosphatase)
MLFDETDCMSRTIVDRFTLYTTTLHLLSLHTFIGSSSQQTTCATGTLSDPFIYSDGHSDALAFRRVEI